MKSAKLFIIGLNAFIGLAVHAQYLYQTNSDNTLTITSYTGTSDGALTLPISAYGLPVTGIAENAFYDVMITSVTIPAGITNLEEPPFGDCIFLNSISVDSANPRFVSVDGILFNKNQTRLIQYPPHKSGTSYVIPRGVTALGADAFASSDYLKSISIPDGVTEIGSGAFFFINLTIITIPASVNFIGDYAFEDDANLVSVYFNGDAPGCGGPYAFEVHSRGNTTAYYLDGTSGWTNEFSDSGPYLNILGVLAQGGVNVVMLPPINFTSSATEGTVPLNVQFTSPSVDGFGHAIAHWNWLFGDGSSSTEQNPSHTYTTAGVYPVSVTEPGQTGGPIAGAVSTVTVSPIFSLLYNFTNGADGASPGPGVVLSGGTVYGVTFSGENGSGYGTLYKVDSDGTHFGVLYTFTNGVDGAYPGGGLTLSGNTLYGTTENGGANGTGTIFAFNLDTLILTNLHSFAQAEGLGPFYTNGDGDEPTGQLALVGQTLFGITVSGGTWGYGTIFGVNTDGSGFTNMHSFSLVGNDGGEPEGLTASGSLLFGTTFTGRDGGAGTIYSGPGTIFSIGIDGSDFTTLYSFTNGIDGGFPTAPLVASGNSLYGTTTGGINGAGTIFSFNSSGLTTLYTFANGADGANPAGGLVLAGNTLYGMNEGLAEAGGVFTNATVFEIETNGSGFEPLLKFTFAQGYLPEATFCIAGETLYGTAGGGGQSGAGTVFSLTLGASSAPQGSLKVTITPPGAAQAGAQWEADDGAPHSSGDTLNLSSGAHIVSFTAAPGWVLPNPRSVTIVAGATTEITGVYFQGTPILTITSPKSGQTVSNGSFVVTGTATDKVPLTNVSFQLNGAGWVTAMTSNSWSNWTANITLAPGANTISAFAQDTAGAVSKTNTVKFLFVPSAALSVQTNGLGSITPVANGKLLAIGTNYTLTASPAKNWLFSNWVASGSESFVFNNPVLKFTMQSNLVLTAHFVTNLFLAAQGAYHGLFAPTGVVREETNSGSFVLNLLSTGAFTGDLFLGSNTVSLAGKFDVGGYVQTNSTVKGGRPLATILQLNVANQAISGMVSDGSFVAQLDGDQNVFGPGHLATEYAGQYTWTIPGTNDAEVGPYGTSYGTVTVNADGDITFAGSLADGTTVSQSSAVSKDGRWPMYLPSSNPNESVFGWNYFTNQTLAAPALVSWIEVTNKAKSALYPSGFTNQEATIVASYYNPAAKPLLSLTEGQVTLEGGGLPFDITNQITLEANNAISVPVTAGNTNKLKLAITLKTGLITGSFLNPANAKQTITINGVLLQNQTNAQGYFLRTNQSGAFLLENP